MANRSRHLMMDAVLSATIILLLHGMMQVDARAVGCGGKPADVVFMLDASNSIWGPDFRKQLHFVKDVIDWFTIGRNEMRVSVITYADYPQLQFHLHYYFTKDQLWAAVDNIRQNGGYHTITADALRYARQHVLGGRGDHIRENVTKVVVVITDGLSDNRTATALEATRTKEAGIHVFAVGVGKDIDLEELDTIASQPSMYYTFLVDGYEGLSNIRELLAIKTCTVTDPPTTTTPTTTTVTTPTPTTSTTTPISTSSGDAFSSKSTDISGKLSGGDTNGEEGDTLRTPVILQPPTFLPFLTQKPLAELKAPDQVNCSQSAEVQKNGTKDGEKTEDGSANKVIEDPRRPCVSKGGADTDHDQTGRPGLSKNESEDGSAKGLWLYDEHGYMIGSHFVKLRNRTVDTNGSDAQMVTEDQASVVDTGLVPEEGLKNISHETRRPEPDDPNVELYFGDNLKGGGGYWYLDERLGYVWYRYISPGVFELDMETTNEVHGANQAALESPNREMIVSAPSPLSGDATSPETNKSSEWYSENQDEKINRTSDDAASPQSTTQVPSGYWGLDEKGRYVWHRYIEAGVYQTIYPVTKTEAELATTFREESQSSTEGIAAEGGLSATARSQTAYEGQSVATEDGRNAGQTLTEVEFDFWRFVKGKRVSFQYVPPNDFDENDEESRLASQREFSGSVDVPSNMAVGDTSNSDGPGKDRRYSEEQRRVWHSSNNLKSGSTSTEEIFLGRKDIDENGTMSVRLNNEKGRELWQQLVNLTDEKQDPNKFPSEMKSRFGIIKDKLPEKQEGNNSEKITDQFHESYWFTDETGRRFQVIHKYNVSDNDEAKKSLHGNADLDAMDNHFPVGKIDATNVRLAHEEKEEHGMHFAEGDGALEYEKYGSEYWIRVLSSSKDIPRKPYVQQPRPGPFATPPRRITPKPLPPQALRASKEREAVDQTKKTGNPNRKQAKGQGNGKPEIEKNTKQKGLPVSGKKKENRKASVKGCRLRKPLDVVITIDRRAKQTSYVDFMVNITQYVLAQLNNTKSPGVQIKLYPEIHHNLEDVEAEGWNVTNEPPAVTLASISNILKKNAAESKRSGKKRSRKIVVYMTDGRPFGGQEPHRKTPAKIGRDVELYVVGVGEETNGKDLEAITRLSPSKSKTHFFQQLNPHSNISNLNDISEELLSAICRA